MCVEQKIMSFFCFFFNEGKKKIYIESVQELDSLPTGIQARGRRVNRGLDNITNTRPYFTELKESRKVLSEQSKKS